MKEVKDIEKALSSVFDSEEFKKYTVYEQLCIKPVIADCIGIMGYLESEAYADAMREFSAAAKNVLEQIEALVCLAEDHTSSEAAKLARRLTEALYVSTASYAKELVKESDRAHPYAQALAVAMEWNRRKKPIFGKGSIEKFNAAAALPCPEDITFMKNEYKSLSFTAGARERLLEAIAATEEAIIRMAEMQHGGTALDLADMHKAKLDVLNELLSLAEDDHRLFASCFDGEILQRFIDGSATPDDIGRISLYYGTKDLRLEDSKRISERLSAERFMDELVSRYESTGLTLDDTDAI